MNLAADTISALALLLGAFAAIVTSVGGVLLARSQKHIHHLVNSTDSALRKEVRELREELTEAKVLSEHQAGVIEGAARIHPEDRKKEE